MDPNETLRLIREACTRFEQGATYEDMDELVEHFRALDRWIRRGGVPPRDWTRDHPTIHRDDYPIKAVSDPVTFTRGGTTYLVEPGEPLVMRDSDGNTYTRH